MGAPSTFSDCFDTEVGRSFSENGYVIVPVGNTDSLNRIRDLVVQSTAEFIGSSLPDDGDGFLNEIHQHVTVEKLNDLRLKCIGEIGKASWFRPAYFSLVQSALESIVGNEIAMQRSLGFSIQLPRDTSSLLPIHADTWDGDSRFEVVQWVPLVNCYKTKSMYILPIDVDRALQKRMSSGEFQSAEAMYKEVEDQSIFLEIPFGHVLLFSQTISHGNRINAENSTRWSMNCRFKSVLSPYADKKLGEFFEPISIRPATRLGFEYELPEPFNE